MTETLVWLLASSLVTGAGIGLLARMPARQILGQCLLLCAVAAGFWGLVALL